MMGTSVLGAAGLLAIGAVPRDAMMVPMMVCCLYFQSLQTSSCDLLSEAQYSAKMRAKPKHGPDLISFVWFGLMATLASGPVIENLGPEAMFAIAAVPAGLVLV